MSVVVCGGSYLYAVIISIPKFSSLYPLC
uniref:Uncharacterized protein n=1 Tax=Rhizophora mucronata TaxID=61149 RepID=A0A2P2QHH9_RHIMU